MQACFVRVRHECMCIGSVRQAAAGGVAACKGVCGWWKAHSDRGGKLQLVGR